MQDAVPELKGRKIRIDSLELSKEGMAALRGRVQSMPGRIDMEEMMQMREILPKLKLNPEDDFYWAMREDMVLCQDLVQVKMSFSHSNLPAIPKLPVDTIFQNHRVTYNRNDYEFVWYYKTFPSIQIPGGMHVCNC